MLTEANILIFKFFLIVFIFFFFFNGTQNQKLISGKAKIIDGDTIHIGSNKIRLHGIDAPELNQNCLFNDKVWNCGKESKKFLINFINNKKISCKLIDKDRYKRHIGICFKDKINLNKKIVQEGWAIAYRYYSKDFVDDENIAKINKLGIWKGDFEEPYLFRKKNK